MTAETAVMEGMLELPPTPLGMVRAYANRFNIALLAGRLGLFGASGRRLVDPAPGRA